MKTLKILVATIISILIGGGGSISPAQSTSKALATAPSRTYAGSSSCRECHEKFYQLWSTSMHGLAMQPYTLGFAAIRLTPQDKDITIGKFRYLADIVEGVVIETGEKGTKKFTHP